MDVAARPGQVGGREGSLVQRARAGLVSAVAAIAARLPEPLLVRGAELAGDVWYRLDRERAARGRRNLGRVCAWLAAEGLGPERARRAASDTDALERLLRAAFRHQARYYLEVALTPSRGRRYVREHLLVETPELVDEAFASKRGTAFVGLHFGALELPVLFFADRTGRTVTVPMETIDDPPLQRWFERTRAAAGVRLVALGEARRELLGALGSGGMVGLVADRDLTGGGIDIPFFGAPAPLPVGPALLALEADAPFFVASVRRVGIGRYRGRLDALEVPPAGASRRERATAFLTAEARVFERVIALAPEQWWGMFFPIWPDLEPSPAAPGARERRPKGAADGRPSPAAQGRPEAAEDGRPEASR